MDRLETDNNNYKVDDWFEFTFQYGQIRNKLYTSNRIKTSYIYIPVWIDQKQRKIAKASKKRSNLHSSMDRLETDNIPKPVNTPPKIYIPVWIDQKHSRRLLS